VLLAIDVRNTQTHLALLGLRDLGLGDIDAVIVSSVVPVLGH
jgi:hypothetical protein